MNFHRHHHNQGAKVNHTARSATAPSHRSAGTARLLASLRAGGSGAGSEGRGGWGRTSSLRVAGLVGLLAATLLALTASSASAALPASFGSNGSGAGQIQGEAKGIAVDQSTGNVYISDPENNRVDKFGPEGEFLFSFGWGVEDGAAEAQICTTATGCQAGLEGAGAGQFHGSEGIAVDNSGGLSSGDVYVLDTRNSRVEKFDSSGNFIAAFGSEGNGPGQFEGLLGRSIFVDGTGTVYVGDTDRVQRFDESGVQQSEVSFPGIGPVENLAVDSTGDIYLKGFFQEPGLHKYSPTGTELGAPREPTGSGEGLATAIGPSDEVFLNSTFSGGEFGHHLLIFDPEGNQLASFDRGGLEQNARALAYSEVTEALYVLNRGTVRIVTPPPPGPLVVSESAAEISTTSATLGATINPEGGAETKCRFQYVDAESFAFEGGFASPNTEETTPTELTGGGFEDQPLSAPVSGLQTRTTYHYRVLCENAAAETTTGPDQEFTTLPPVSIDATFATSVAATSATLNAELNPHGLTTTYRFEYDTVEYTEGGGPHGTSTPSASAGSGTVDVTRSAQVQGLAPETTYHFRVLAENSLGISFGPDIAFTTQGATASLLPDGRVWEMVTPPNKFGSPVESLTEAGGAIQAPAVCTSTDCNFASIALGPLGPEAKGNRASPQVAQWFSSRGSLGWSTQDITSPNEEVSIVHVGVPAEYKLFAEDLSSSVVEPDGKTPQSPLTTGRTPYRREATGEFVPLVTAENVPPGTEFGVGGNTGVEFLTATPSLSHILLGSTQLLAPGFEEDFEPGEQNIYELAGDKLTLVSVLPLPDGRPTSEANLNAQIGHEGRSMRGAISTDGSRVTFEASSSSFGNHLYLRDVPLAQTLQLDEVQPEAEAGPGVPQFQAANSDASKVFFTDDSRLTSDSTAKPSEPDLYMCEIKLVGGAPSCALFDLSANHLDPAEAASICGGGGLCEVGAIDSTGEHIYFTANGVLTTTPNGQGEVAVPGDCTSAGEATCNLYQYNTDARQISLVAVLSSHDDPVWAGPTSTHALGNLTARSSPGGRYFTFMSTRSLTGYDNRDARSGQRDAEVYQFDSSSAKLSCVSCNPTGARPNGVFDIGISRFPGLLVDHPYSWEGRWLAASIPGWTLGPNFKAAIYQSRYLSNSGREFFNSADALVAADTNGVMDVYQYEPPGVGDCTTSSSTYSPTSGGCVSLISSGTSAEESAFLDASESGDDVFFLTQSKLASTDVDNAFDVYDASVGGKTYETVNPVECSGDACQQPATPPLDPTPGSLTFQGAGNVVQCPKGKVKKHGKCAAKHKAKKHKKAHKQHARSKRGSK